MRAGRILAVARKSLAQFRHDRRTLAFVLIMPLLMVVAFGYTFGGEVHDVRTLVVNQDAGPAAALFLSDVNPNTLSLVTATDPVAARSEVARGHAWALLWFPANFSADLLARDVSLRVSLDGSSPPIVAAVLGALRAAAEKAFAGAGGASVFSLTPDYVYGSPDTRFIDSFAPGIIALAVLMVTTIFSVVIIVREKTGGMLERLFSTPLRPMELVLGHALALSGIAVVQSAVVLGAALLLFQVQVVGNGALVFVVLLLFAVGNQGLGMVASAAARNELQAVQFIPAVLFPSLLLTGVFYPLEAIPGGLRPLSWFVPMTYANDAMHSVMLRGWGAGDIGTDLAVLGIYAVLTLLAAAFFIRRQA